ncbi:MAG: NUDIX domain-containing protein [Lachnospiraceae bacterium]|nr:NUDIX domain-containing protein [Lachnospiraceae bacterium]
MERTEIVTLTSMCMISDDNGNVLVLNKVNNSYTGITFPGGHVEKGEPFTSAIIREVYEETGLHIKHPILCGIYNWMYEDGSRYIVMIYKTSEFTGELKSSEEGEVFWIPLSEFGHMNLAEGMSEVLEICQEDEFAEVFMYQEKGQWIEMLL